MRRAAVVGTDSLPVASGDADRHDYGSRVLTLFLVAISVGLDNLGAATAIGVSGVSARLRLRIPLVFGGFEAVMPLVGLLVGRAVSSTIGGNTKLVAGSVLCLVGAYTIVSELLERPDGSRPSEPSLARLVVLGATLSIDNLAIGFALGTYHVNVVLAALVIAAFSVALTLLGLEAGARLGARLGRRSEAVGGVLLLGLGVAVATSLI